MTEMELYWLLKLDHIRSFFETSVFVLFLGGLILLLVVSINLSEGNIESKKWLFIPMSMLLMALLSGISVALIPTTKQMACIVVLPKIINDEQVREIPSKIVDLADSWIDELKPKQEEK